MKKLKPKVIDIRHFNENESQTIEKAFAVQELRVSQHYLDKILGIFKPTVTLFIYDWSRTFSTKELELIKSLKIKRLEVYGEATP